MIKSKGIFALMQKDLNKDHSFRKTKVAPPLLFALTFLLLFVSCPVKKFLLTNFIHDTSSFAANNETSNNKSNKVNYALEKGNCSFANDPFFTTDSYRIKILLPVFYLNSSCAAGFKINYFINGLNSTYYPLITDKNLSVPLFLQHLRLLI